MKGKGSAQGLPLNLLPSPTEPLIYDSIGARGRNSLLAVSRWGRDVILREAQAIYLKLLPSDAEAGANLRPLARLLARACEAAEAGQLSLSLDASMAPPAKGSKTSNVLAQLLDVGIKQSGWTTVAELKLRVSKAGSASQGVCICIPMIHDRSSMCNCRLPPAGIVW
jgi:hypothetical protein